jgi:hypothetical protein
VTTRKDGTGVFAGSMFVLLAFGVWALVTQPVGTPLQGCVGHDRDCYVPWAPVPTPEQPPAPPQPKEAPAPPPLQVIELKVGTVEPFTLSTPFASVQISNPIVADVIPQTDELVLLVPNEVGQTSIVFADQSRTILRNVIVHVQSSLPAGDYVPIYVKEGSVWVDVQLGSLTKRLLIDTGATDVTVTKSVANDLLRRGDAVLDDPGAASDFEGWTHIENRIQILTLGVGGHTLHNVLAGVVPDEAEMLLGFSVLNQVGRFTIDTKNNQLIFQ